uniref:SH3 domain-containing protein n=1 Tax=Cyanoderma ruficeps TaxID=181631 RepID=A0A8C3NP92_9PASS
MLIAWKHSKLNIVIKLPFFSLFFSQNYMMFVSWSDQNNILIYRTFEDFKKFHVREGAQPRITLQQRKGGKLNRCLEILKLLETYSQELLKTDVKISRGEEVNQFFKAQTQDLDPSFPENSVVIMPSVFRREKNPRPLSITLPQASQSYRCMEAFETQDTKNKPFTVAQKEIVEVLIKDMTGWWLVENADKQIAWFPASYLEELDACEDMQNAFSSDEEGKSVPPSKHEFYRTSPLNPLPGVPAWTSDSSGCGLGWKGVQRLHRLHPLAVPPALPEPSPQAPDHAELRPQRLQPQPVLPSAPGGGRAPARPGPAAAPELSGKHIPLPAQGQLHPGAGFGQLLPELGQQQ